MAYTRNPTWKNDSSGGTPITATKLETIEAGILNAAAIADQALASAGGWDALVTATGNDQSDELQSKLDGIPDGGVLQIKGQVRIAKPIVLRRNKVLRGQVSPRWPYQTAPVTCIRPTSGFSGLAAILIPEAAITDSSLPAMTSARTSPNDNGQLIDVAVDCGAISPGGDRGIYGVFFEGLVRNWRVRNLSTLSARGIGVAFSQGRGTASPRGIDAEHVQAVYSKNTGIVCSYTTDSNLVDLLAVGGEVDGQIHYACAESHITQIRSVFNKGRGTVLAGNRDVANAVHYGELTTDRNAFDGVVIQQTGSLPLYIETIVANRDGSASTTADYAGVVFGDASNRAGAVFVTHLEVGQGVDDPAAAGQTGGGNRSPQHSIRQSGTTRVFVNTRVGWSMDTPVLDKGDHLNAPYSSYDYLRQGTDGTVKTAGPN